jgi:dephospho-CoA kinase
MKVVGLTGGIGCGKSMVASVWRENGIEVLDTDDISHDLTRTGGEAIQPIREVFGPASITADGMLDRKAMRELVFSDRVARAKLETILHTKILLRCQIWVEQLKRNQKSIAVLVVPLLFERGNLLPVVDRVVAVDCDVETQINRVMMRSKISREDVLKILSNQVSRAVRLARADDIVCNNSDNLNHGKQCAQSALTRLVVSLSR